MKRRHLLGTLAALSCSSIGRAANVFFFRAATVVSAPVNTVAPTVTGTPQEGQTLTGVHGTWSNTPTSYTYQWSRATTAGGTYSNISGATSITYSPVTGDVSYYLKFSELASNAAGAAASAATSSATGVVVAGVANTMTVTNKSGSTITNWPLEFGRAFIQGAFPTGSYPKVVIDGTPAATQVNVKNTWPDGSVKYAAIACLVPSNANNVAAAITFTTQASANNTALSKSDMLDSAYDFNAVLQCAFGGAPGTQSASARTMLNADKYTTWNSGPIAQQVIIADHSTSRAYDMGASGQLPVRPIFHATFYPTINKVRVRVIGENILTTQMRDITYDLTITTGNASPASVYTKSGLAHRAATRWSKEHWINTAPTAVVNVDHNLAYLAATTLVPNYDTSLVVPSGTITSQYTAWGSANKDLYEAGLWTKYMPTSGGHAELGPAPDWHTYWLYTGDYRMREIVLKQAELAGAWPNHIREGDNTKFIDGVSAPGLGKVASIKARPTDTGNISFFRQGSAYSDDGWTNDGAHEPDPFTVPYLLTGDYYWIENLQFWAGAWAGFLSASYRQNGLGGIADQPRGNGWLLLHRAHAAVFSPDSTDEKTYLTAITNGALKNWDDILAGTQTTTYSVNGLVNNHPLRFSSSDTGDAQNLNPAQTTEGTPPWMEHIFQFGVVRAKQLGFNATTMFNWFAPNIIGALTDASYNPWLVEAYRTPTRDESNVYFTTWAAQLTGFYANSGAGDGGDSNQYQNKSAFAFSSDYSFGYCYIASCVLAGFASETNGATAWSTLRTMLGSSAINAQNTNPKWAIVPRP